MKIIRALAQPLIAAPFIVAGLDAVLHPKDHREAAERVNPLMNRIGLPALEGKKADTATRALGGVTIAAGTALALNRGPRVAAWTLVATNLPVALARSPFWAHRGAARRKDLTTLASSLGLIGGAIVVAGGDTGKPNLRWRAAARRERTQALRELKAAHRAQLREAR